MDCVKLQTWRNKKDVELKVLAALLLYFFGLSMRKTSEPPSFEEISHELVRIILPQTQSFKTSRKEEKGLIAIKQNQAGEETDLDCYRRIYKCCKDF